jgi:NAD(P)-dependent dehydrogenase (short-subunit alcohol dehydrogenase family)
MPTFDRGEFAGKVAFTTGVAGGVGRATAVAFAEVGAYVLADIDESGNKRLPARSSRPAVVPWRCAATSRTRPIDSPVPILFVDENSAEHTAPAGKHEFTLQSLPRR